MKRLCLMSVRVLLFVALAIGIGSILSFAAWRSREHGTVLGAEGSQSVPVIVELFTSEGCSSCPPADALLAQYEGQQPIAHAQVIALEEHVDYWNEPGWVDRCSAREYSDRQAEYAAVLKNGNPYTPQMVVDGHTEFVGSHERTAQQAITRAAMDEKSDVSIRLEKANKSGDQGLEITVGTVRAAAVGDTTEVWLAMTEAGLHSAVTRGENTGRDLDHASIVRVLRKIGSVDQKKGVGFSRSLTVPLDPQWKRANLRAVVFLQERKSRRVLGAAATSVGE